MGQSSNPLRLPSGHPSRFKVISDHVTKLADQDKPEVTLSNTLTKSDEHRLEGAHEVCLIAQGGHGHHAFNDACPDPLQSVHLL